MWALAARAQPSERMRRIGMLMAIASDDIEADARVTAFLEGLKDFGWIVGQNVVIETRWTAGKADNIRKYAAELIALAPDVILASGGSVLGPLLESPNGVPVVFTLTTDPVGAGFVESLARPGGNLTGF